MPEFPRFGVSMAHEDDPIRTIYEWLAIPKNLRYTFDISYFQYVENARKHKFCNSNFYVINRTHRNIVLLWDKSRYPKT
jgi:hypothetical protein